MSEFFIAKTNTGTFFFAFIKEPVPSKLCRECGQSEEEWRWRELHPRPKDSSLRGLHAQFAINLIPQASANEILKDDPPRSFP